MGTYLDLRSVKKWTDLSVLTVALLSAMYIEDQIKIEHYWRFFIDIFLKCLIVIRVQWLARELILNLLEHFLICTPICSIQFATWSAFKTFVNHFSMSLKFDCNIIAFETDCYATFRSPNLMCRFAVLHVCIKFIFFSCWYFRRFCPASDEPTLQLMAIQRASCFDDTAREYLWLWDQTWLRTRRCRERASRY